MRVLFHFVSGQNLPNLIASKIVNPDLNLFLCTEQSENQFAVFKKTMVNSSSEIIEAWDYEKIKNQISTILDRFKDDVVILNFTAGNKIMSLAAFDLFREKSKDCLYVNTEKDEFIFFDNSKNKIIYSPIKVKLDIIEILSINNQEYNFGLENLSPEYEKLKEIISKDKDLIQELLKMALKFNNSQKDFDEEIKRKSWKGSQIKFSNEKSFVRLVNNGNEIFNLSEDGKDLLEILFGKWFEYSCLDALKKLNYFDDVRPDITIIRKGTSISEKYRDKNQIDIFGIKGIYSYIFECKAGNIKSEAIDKLISIKENYIGRYSSLFFISKYPLDVNNSSHKNVLEKITDNNINHLTFRDLFNKEYVIKIFNQRKNLR